MENSIIRPSDETINDEITRLGELLDTHEARYNLKLMIANIVPEKSIQVKTCLNYYEMCVDFLKCKRRFWSQYRDKSMDKNALDILQDKMDLWLQSSWNYLGMEEVEQQSKTSKEEFQLFKLMYNTSPKKTRRKKKK